MIDKVQAELTVSKIEHNELRYTGVDVKKVKDGIEIAMEDYVRSLNEIKEFRPAKKNDPLVASELKVYRGYTGKLSWLAENVRPDLSFTALNMSKKGVSAVMSDLKQVNHSIRKAKERPSKIVFKNIVDSKEDLEVIGVGDASYKWDDKSVGGNIVLLSNKTSKQMMPVFWKSKQIARSVHSSKDA